ncbi:hypothetical protein M9H77_18046 [Catharanthus roseus]|uniref:Uncharacterized protein n=1 Tax=Catharanthus roseus TaxID=4058 RepID=A0ACC0B6C4_CATRO|nr:hypothetical protein M9H77_18046 [Catharanthus roseus]
MKVNTYLIITRYLRSRTYDRRPYVTLACERVCAIKSRTKPRVDDEEEEVPIKRRGPYGTKKCGYPFKLKGEQMAMSENWQLFVHDGRHNHKIGAYSHDHAQAARLTEEQLTQTEQFRKSHVSPRNILRFFREQNVDCAVSVYKLYNVVAKIKKNRMQGETRWRKFFASVFNGVIWSSIETARTTTRHINQNVLAKLTEVIKDEEFTSQFINGSWHKLINEIDEADYLRKLDIMKTKWQKKPLFLHYLFNTWLNPLAHKFCRVWTSQVLHFGVETTNRVEKKHSVLKLWLSTCHSDLDTVFLNVGSIIESQIAEIKSSLEFSKLKEKFNVKSNPILKNISNNISHLALKKI